VRGSTRPEPDLGAFEELEDDAVVQREGRLGEGRPGEEDEADAIHFPAPDESLDGLFCDEEPVVGLEVERGHGAGDIKGENDVDALPLGDGVGTAGLRAGKGENEAADGEDAQEDRDPAQLDAQ